MPDTIYDLFKGDKPMPVNVGVPLELLYGDNELIKFTQSVIPCDVLSESVRKVVRLLEEKSLTSAIPFREMAGFVFVYADGSGEARYFTSDLPDRVESDVHFTAIDECRILDELDQGKMPRAVMHIHTHPGMEYKPAAKKDHAILINQTDFRGYQQLSAFFSAYAGKTIPVMGLVKPVGEHCNNVIFETEAVPHDNSTGMQLKALAYKGRRAAAAANGGMK